jgi:hypothetical protein
MQLSELDWTRLTGYIAGRFGDSVARVSSSALVIFCEALQESPAHRCCYLVAALAIR